MTCLLLLKGANPNIANKGGVVPLTIATRMGFKKIVEVLVACGAEKVERRIKFNSNDAGSEVDKVILLNHTQGLFGSFSAAKATRGTKTEINDTETRDLVQVSLEAGTMILPDAAHLGLNEPIFAALRPDNLEDVDKDGHTMLMKASFCGNESLIKELLARGCKIDAIDKFGNTAMVWAALNNRLGALKILHQHSGCVNGAVDTIQDSLTKVRGQMTPLFAAAYRGNNSIVRYLVQEGCSINLRCGANDGKSALMVAACNRKKECVRTLMQNQAVLDPNCELWLHQGTTNMKKYARQRNAWLENGIDSICLVTEGSDSKFKFKIASRPDGKSGLKDNTSCFTSEDMTLTADIKILLSEKYEEKGPPLIETFIAEPIIALNDSTPPMRNQLNKKKNRACREGLNLDVKSINKKIIGPNSDCVLALAEQIPNSGTDLDFQWVGLFQCVVQLMMAANKNIKNHYIAISAKAIHYSSEIVRAIEKYDKKLNIGPTIEYFCDTIVKVKIRELNKIVSADFPKKLMLATRMATGVWPPPDSVAEMINEAARLASTCRELVLLANTLGIFPVSEKSFQVTFEAFQESAGDTAIKSATEDKDVSLKGGLNYLEYKRQNDLKLIEEMSKKYDVGSKERLQETLLEDTSDAEFTAALDSLLKQFVVSVTELKKVHDQHLTEEFINCTSIVHARADTIMEEILNFEPLKEISDDLMLQDANIQKLQSLGVKLQHTETPTPIKPYYRLAFDDVRSAAKVVMARGKIASVPWPTPGAYVEMLQSCIPCVLAVKKLVLIAKETALLVRTTGSEERQKRFEWKKECLANERVKRLFQTWESQTLGEGLASGKGNNNNIYNSEEIEMLQDPIDGLIFDETCKKVKGGRLGKLIEILSGHNPTIDVEYTSIFFMTHHSFTTSIYLLDQLFKRYDITPPYGLNQRMFEIYLDKKVVQVRLRYHQLIRVCHILLYWIQNHFEEDFVDNDLLVYKLRDFISRVVISDFETMAIQILDALSLQMESTKNSALALLVVDKDKCPKPILVSQKFTLDLIPNVLLEARTFSDIDPLEMARQLTLIEFELYRRVQAYECTDQIWESHYKKESAAILQKSNSHSKRHVPGSQNSDISKLIRHTNEHCRDFNNLTGVTTIVAGLTMGPIGRLHKSWQSLEDRFPKISEAYTELHDLVSPKFQYANYRKCLKEMVPPAIPFLGVYLTDLTFLELGNPAFLPDSHFINFDKRRKVFMLIQEIQKFQKVPYAFVAIPQIQNYMTQNSDTIGLNGIGGESRIMTEEELYEKSFEYEPKEISSDDESE